MKNYRFLQQITTAITVVTLFSCEGNVLRKTEQANATGEQQIQPNISYGELIIKEQSDYLMIPVNLTDSNQDKDNKFDISRSYERKNNNRWYNFIFYNKQTGENNILLNKKAIITSFDLLEVKTAGKPPIRLWFYKIIDQDTNGDKKLNGEDALTGYFSDLSGKNLQQITPNNTTILTWVVLPSQNALFLKIIKDSDNNKKFTQVDKTNFIRVNLAQPSIGNEIIGDKIEQQIKSTINSQ